MGFRLGAVGSQHGVLSRGGTWLDFLWLPWGSRQEVRSQGPCSRSSGERRQGCTVLCLIFVSITHKNEAHFFG